MVSSDGTVKKFETTRFATDTEIRAIKNPGVWILSDQTGSKFGAFNFLETSRIVMYSRRIRFDGEKLSEEFGSWEGESFTIPRLNVMFLGFVPVIFWVFFLWHLLTIKTKHYFSTDSFSAWAMLFCGIMAIFMRIFYRETYEQDFCFMWSILLACCLLALIISELVKHLFVCASPFVLVCKNHILTAISFLGTLMMVSSLVV
jgi:hypothetical protein